MSVMSALSVMTDETITITSGQTKEGLIASTIFLIFLAHKSRLRAAPGAWCRISLMRWQF